MAFPGLVGIKEQVEIPNYYHIQEEFSPRDTLRVVDGRVVVVGVARRRSGEPDPLVNGLAKARAAMARLLADNRPPADITWLQGRINRMEILLKEESFKWTKEECWERAQLLTALFVVALTLFFVFSKDS